MFVTASETAATPVCLNLAFVIHSLGKEHRHPCLCAKQASLNQRSEVSGKIPKPKSQPPDNFQSTNFQNARNPHDVAIVFVCAASAVAQTSCLWGKRGILPVFFGPITSARARNDEARRTLECANDETFPHRRAIARAPLPQGEGRVRVVFLVRAKIHDGCLPNSDFVIPSCFVIRASSLQRCRRPQDHYRSLSTDQRSPITAAHSAALLHLLSQQRRRISELGELLAALINAHC